MRTVPEGLTPIVFKLTIAAAVLFLWWPQYGNATMEITPRLSAGSYFTDNVQLEPDNTESDYISTITPGINFNLYGRNAGLALSYDPSYVHYANDTYDAYWRQVGTVEGWWQPGRHTHIALTNNFLSTEDPISNEDLTVRTGRNPYTRNRSNISLEQQFGAESTFRVAFEHGILDNEDPTNYDSQRYVPSLALTHWLNVRWGFDLSAVYSRAEYDAPEAEIPNDYDNLIGSLRLLHRFNRQTTGYLGYAYTYHKYDYADEVPEYVDYTVNDAFVGFDYTINTTTSLAMSVHYIVRDLENVATTSDDPATPVNLDFTKTFQHGSFALNVGGGYNYTVLTAEDLGFYEYYGGGLNGDYNFTRRITGDIFGLYEWRDYKDIPGGRDDDILRIGCGLSFELLRWLTMRAGYQYRTIESTTETFNYQENRVSILFTLAPPQPYRF